MSLTQRRRFPARQFDVICLGEPLRRASTPSVGEIPRARGSAFVDIAKMLTAAGLHVGWAAVLEDTRRGRALLAEMAAIDVEVGAVRFAPVATGLVVVDASGMPYGVVSERGGAAPAEVPSSWSARVLLLAGPRPVTSALAAFCKAARRARREGSAVVLDLVGGLRDWKGHDARVISMVLREADVVRCSLFDLAVIGTNANAVRQAMRPTATLVLDDGHEATALGPFGDVRVEAPSASSATGILGESYTAAICVEYARSRGIGETPAGRWHRVLRHEAPRLAAAGPSPREQRPHPRG